MRIEVLSHQTLKQQTRVIGATWLDRELASGSPQLALQGFGAEVREALEERADFLVEESLARRQGQRLVLTADFMMTLRDRELSAAGKALAEETGLTHLPTVDGRRIPGIYSRSVTLASGRFAMIDNGMGFSLVPWAPVIEKRLCQSLTATVRGDTASWDIGRGLVRSITITARPFAQRQPLANPQSTRVICLECGNDSPSPSNGRRSRIAYQFASLDKSVGRA